MPDVDYTKVVDGELLKWTEIGTVVEGVLANYETKNTANGIGHVYEIRTKDGITPFFAPQLLQKKLRDIPVGQIVRVEYVKESKTQAGNTLKHFDVGHALATPEILKTLGIELMTPVEDEPVEEIPE